MTVLAHVGYRRQMAYSMTLMDASTTSQNRLAVFKGTMPSNLTDWVVADSSADLLVEFTGFNWAQSSVGDKDRVIFNVSPTPNPVNATATGTAAWYAYYHSVAPTRYLFGDVSLVAGTGSLHISTGGSPDSLAIVSGNPVTLLNWSIQFAA